MNLSEFRTYTEDLPGDTEILFETPGWNVDGCEYADVTWGWMRNADLSNFQCPECEGTGKLVVDTDKNVMLCPMCQGTQKLRSVVRHHILDRTPSQFITVRTGNLRLKGDFKAKAEAK